MEKITKNGLIDQFFRLSAIAMLMSAFAFMTISCVEEEAILDQLDADIIMYFDNHDGANFRISDGSHEGNSSFYFLPPMVKKVMYFGQFDGSQSPIVEISDDFEFESLHAYFDMNGEGPSQVRVDSEEEHYIVNWSALRTKAEVGKVYRIRVRLGDNVLGYADVAIVSNGSHPVPEGTIKMVSSQTLPIKFRIEGDGGDDGAIIRIEVSPEESVIDIGGEQQFTAFVFGENDQELFGKSITWEVSDPTVASIDNSGLAIGLAFGFVTVTATAEGISGTATLFVQEGEGPRPGRDVVVFNDVNVFDDVAMQNPNNIQLVKNLINYETVGIRANAKKVLFDCGRDAMSGDTYTPCKPGSGPYTYLPFRNTIIKEGFIIEDVYSSSGSLSNIADDIKVIFLFIPNVSFTINEINELKKFAEEGGRIVFIGEHERFYGNTGITVENEFLINMGAVMRNVGNAVDCGGVTLPQASIRPHPITRDVQSLSIGCASVIELGPNDFPLFYDTSNTLVLGGVAAIDTNPITELQGARMWDLQINVRINLLNPTSPTGH